jgi:hypothetical protein
MDLFFFARLSLMRESLSLLIILKTCFIPNYLCRCNCGHYSTTHHTQSNIQIRQMSQEQTLKCIDTYKNSFFYLLLRVGLLFLKVTLGLGFQSVKSTFVFLERKDKNNQSKAEIDGKRSRKV